MPKLSTVMAICGGFLIGAAAWFAYEPSIAAGWAMVSGIGAVFLLGVISGAVDKWPSSRTTSRPPSTQLE